jgi:hypothetical protein
VGEDIAVIQKQRSRNDKKISRHNHSPTFTAKVALEALKGHQTVIGGGDSPKASQPDIEELHAKIGQQASGDRF